VVTFHGVSYGWRAEDGIVAEICDECGFDSRRVTDVMAGLGSVLTTMQDLLTDPDVDVRPGAETWSAAEYVDHTISVIVECVEEVAGVAGLSVGETPTSCQTISQFLEVFERDLDSRDLDQLMIEAPFAVLTATGNLHHALHDAEHHALDIRRGYARLALARGTDLHTTVR
jgi:hypothetical protein